MPESNGFVEFIKANKIYFIIIFCVLNLAGFFYYNNSKSTSVTGMMNEADNFAQNGQIAYAIENYNKIVRVYPENYEAHIKLAELYLQANERDMAKVEYIKAIDLNYSDKFQANTAIANLYIQEKNFPLAEKFIKKIKINNSEAKQNIGDFYFKWGLSLKKTNKPESVRKLKTAYKYYKASNSPNLHKLKKEISSVYIDISNDFLSIKRVQDAIDILKLSLKFRDDSETHYRLAKIYEKQGKIDATIDEYQKAFNLNPDIASTNHYVQLLTQRAEMFKEKGDKVSADLYYLKAKKVDSSVNVPINPDASIIINNLTTKCNEKY